VAQKLTGGMPTDPDLGGSWQVIFAAVDPTTGDAVAGVKVSHAALLVATDAAPDALTSGPFMLVPGPES
jgi:hypothetical protein